MFDAPLKHHPRYLKLQEDRFYSREQLLPLEQARLVHLNQALAAQFGLTPEHFSHPHFLRYLEGAPLPEGYAPLAQAYSGHQFGQFNPTLGDGRALMLTEVEDRQGQTWEFHLKGSGPTRYSRGFDGRAVLRSVIREYLASEAMHCLGVPTTRALCVIDSQTPVMRETQETGAMMIRLSPSHLRFGTFELYYSQGDREGLQQLVEFCIEHHYPHLQEQEDATCAWFAEVVKRSARLVAQWQAVGFCHGVINTDNFSALGLTIDYGPFGFLETYDPGHICNHSDLEGRYAYNQQPRIGLWNCLCLAQALTPLVAREKLEAALEGYEPALQAGYLEVMRPKLGLSAGLAEDKEDSALMGSLLALLETQKLDYHRFLRGLCHYQPGKALPEWLTEAGNRSALAEWLKAYDSRLSLETDTAAQREARMCRHNPKYILRNYLAQQAIVRAEQADYSELERLLALLQSPFDEHAGSEDYAAPVPDWASGLAVSCSS